MSQLVGSAFARRAPAEIMFGVQLKHLAELPLHGLDVSFQAACEYVKSKTTSMDSLTYRSYANYLRKNQNTKHLVKDLADVFVSYAWKGGFATTMQALMDHYQDKSEDIYVWMDFAIVDQHLAATTNVVFDEWVRVFEDNLKATGKAILVLTPGTEPIAMSRSWCCFEWVTIARLKIPYDFCVPTLDVNSFIEKILNGEVGDDDLRGIYSNVNVRTAEASKESDRVAILKLMTELGILEVNNIVMNSVKAWIENVLAQAVTQSPKRTLKESLAYAVQAEFYRVSGRLDQAIVANRVALRICKDLQGHEAEKMSSIVLANLALAQSDLKLHEEAESNIRESLCIKLRLYPNRDDIELADSYASLGAVLSNQGRFDDAKEALGNAVKISDNILPENLPKAALFHLNYGYILLRLNDLDMAEEVLQDAVRRVRKVYGEHDDNALISTALGYLAKLNQMRNRFETSETYYVQALTICRRVYGDQNQATIVVWNNLGYVLMEQSKFAEAETAFKASLDVLRSGKLGKNNLDLATGICNLAKSLAGQNRLVEAIACYREALNVCTALFGEDHLHSAVTMEKLAEMLQNAGEEDEAASVGLRAYQIYLACKGSEDPMTIKLRRWSGRSDA